MSMTYNVRRAGAVTVVDLGGRIELIEDEATAVRSFSKEEEQRASGT